MTSNEFNQILEYTINRCKSLLQSKSKEYATDDRLHNFKSAANLKGETPIKTLAGMMAKHTISVYDMCMSGQDYTKALWDEKICDSINYLILLRALVEENILPKDKGAE